MEQVEVVDVVLDERDYQDEMTANPDRPDMIDLSFAATMFAIEHNLDEIRDVWYTDAAPYQKSMEYVRKIAALCIRAGEKYGMPGRQRN